MNFKVIDEKHTHRFEKQRHSWNEPIQGYSFISPPKCFFNRYCFCLFYHPQEIDFIYSDSLQEREREVESEVMHSSDPSKILNLSYWK